MTDIFDDNFDATKLNIKELRSVIQEHRLDSAGITRKWDLERTRQFLIKRINDRKTHGSVFRQI